jgi:predicted nucleic acid-binding protein
VRHYFLDTSALVKAYAWEDGSRQVRDILRGSTAVPAENLIIVSILAHPEAASALSSIMAEPSAVRRGLGAYERRTLPGVLAGQFTGSNPLVVTPADPHAHAAAALGWKHRVKGADAVHLATALAFRNGLPKASEFYFVSSDVALNRAAQAEGLAVIDPAA